jgi:vacuolar-type H+-ATPase subunit E/Vma4
MAEPSEKLFSEVRSDARAKADEIGRKAQSGAEDLKRQTAEEIRTATASVLGAAKKTAETKRSEILASVAVEVQRERLAAAEKILQSVQDGVRRKLAALSPRDAQASQVRLALEAVGQLPPNVPVDVALPAAAHGAFGAQLVQEIMKQAAAVIKRPVTVRLAAQPGAIADGVVVRTADGRIEIVNSLDERLRRLWPQLRLEIAAKLFPAETGKK